MILVTGGTGLTGSHLLLSLLKDGLQVRAIFRNRDSIGKTKKLFSLYHCNNLFPLINWIEADITDVPSLEKAFVGITHVYHCAALISFDPGDEEKLRKNNIEGTANIVNLCIDFKIEKLCHVSSTAALGDLKDHETAITEETEWNPEKPHNDYAISKYGAEMELWRGFQEGLKIVIVNPGIIIGPGFVDSGSGMLFNHIANGLRYYTTGKAGYVSVADVIVLMRKLMASDISGKRFIAVGQNLTYREVLFAVADAMQLKRPTIHAKPWMTSLAWQLDWLSAIFLGMKRKLSRDDARLLHSVSEISAEKTRNELDYIFGDVFTAIETTARLNRGL